MAHQKGFGNVFQPVVEVYQTSLNIYRVNFCCIIKQLSTDNMKTSHCCCFGIDGWCWKHVPIEGFFFKNTGQLGYFCWCTYMLKYMHKLIMFVICFIKIKQVWNKFAYEKKFSNKHYKSCIHIVSYLILLFPSRSKQSCYMYHCSVVMRRKLEKVCSQEFPHQDDQNFRVQHQIHRSHLR